MSLTRRNILITIFVLLVVLTLLVSWYTRHQATDENLYDQALTKLARSQSLQVKVELETFFDPSKFTASDVSGGVSSLDVPLNISGPVTISYPKGSTVTGRAELDFSAGFGVIKLLSLDALLADDGGMYARVRNLPDDWNLSLDVKNLNDTWFSFSGRDLTRLFSWFGSSDSNELFATTSTLQADELRIAAADWLLPAQRYQDTVMNGRAAAHYELVIDRERLTDLLAVIVGALRGRSCSENERTAIVAGLNNHRLLAEAWVDKTNQELRLLTFGIFPTEGASDSMPLALTLAFTAFDGLIDSTAPPNVNPLSNINFSSAN
jgi:hypothetical protein